jgi:hypothetical protein
MLKKDTLILGVTSESRLVNIVKVLSVYGDILSNSKITSDVIKLKIKEHLVKVNGEELFQGHIQTIWGSLNEKQRNNLTAIANS